MERKDKTIPTQPHQLIMQDRRQVELTGVADVDSFDENTVIVYTSLGQLTVRGSGLHIQQLNLEGGSLSIEGQVDSLLYADTVKGGGFFSRLFR